jgi:hypothetical protein
MNNGVSISCFRLYIYREDRTRVVYFDDSYWKPTYLATMLKTNIVTSIVGGVEQFALWKYQVLFLPHLEDKHSCNITR